MVDPGSTVIREIPSLHKQGDLVLVDSICSVICPHAGITMGRLLSVCGNIGTNTVASSPG